MVKQSGVYTIRCETNGAFYIGSTEDLHRRSGIHKAMLRNGKHTNKPLQRTWDEHGEESFTFEVLAEVPILDLRNVEQRYLDEMWDLPGRLNIEADASAVKQNRAQFAARIDAIAKGLGVPERLPTARTGGLPPFDPAALFRCTREEYEAGERKPFSLPPGPLEPAS